MVRDIDLKLPDKSEYILFIIGMIFFAIFDYAQNKYQAFGHTFSEPSFFFGMKLIHVFLLFLFLYLVVVLVAITRALIRRSTHYSYDFIAGVIMLFGIYIIAAGGIAAIYYRPEQAIPWFLNIPQITLYHVLGVFMQIVPALYFFITD